MKITNNNKEIINLDTEHNHLSDSITYNKMILKNNIKEKINSFHNNFQEKQKIFIIKPYLNQI